MQEIVPSPAAPMNVEAEQQLLGCILLYNDQMHRVLPVVQAEHFFDPVHALIFERCRIQIDAERPANPVTLKAFLEREPGIQALGGPSYLVRLAGAALAPVLALDYAKIVRDLADRRFALEAIDTARQSILSGDETAAAVVSRLETVLDAMQDDVGARGPVSMMKATTDALRDVNAAYMGEAPLAIPTGIQSIDAFAPILSPGNLVYLGGRPGMGKSAVALSIALGAARRGHHVIFSTLEMDEKQLAVRALSEAASSQGNTLIEYSRAMQGNISENDMRVLVEAARSQAELPITFVPSEYGTIETLPAGIRMAKRRAADITKMPLIVVDYIQLLEAEGTRGLYEQVTKISKRLKMLARRLQAPILAVAQLSREVEKRADKRPVLSDLRDSGQLEQDADAVLFCYREEYYLQRESHDETDLEMMAAWQDAMERAKNVLELSVSKQRMGPVRTVKVRFNPATNYIWEI